MNDVTNTSSVKRLAIYVRQGGIDGIISSEDGRICFSNEVEPSINEPAKVLEESVYNTPKLLGDYKSTDIVCGSRHFVAAPSELASDSQLLTEMSRRLWPDEDCSNLTVNQCFGSSAIISVIDKSLVGFAGRTFTRVSFHHRLSTLVNFFASLSRPVNRVKLYAHFAGQNTLDIVALSSDSLLMANSFECSEPADAVYYIMASVKDCGLDQLDDEVVVCGDDSRISELTDNLRQYLNSVMPLLLTVNDKESALELLQVVNE